MSKVPALLMERLALGELPEAEARRVREALGEGADRALEALRADDGRVRGAFPAEAIVPRIRQRAAGLARPPRALVLWLMPALAGAAALAVALKGGVTDGLKPPPVEETRSKGDPKLVLRLQAPDGRTRAGDTGALAGKGDLVQVSVAGNEVERFGVVVSIDGRGHVTRHLPEDGPAAAAIPAKEQLLPHAYELDDAPEFERFVLVTAREAFDVEVVLAAVRALPADGARSAPLVLPAGLSQRSTLLQKKERK